MSLRGRTLEYVYGGKSIRLIAYRTISIKIFCAKKTPALVAGVWPRHENLSVVWSIVMH